MSPTEQGKLTRDEVETLLQASRQEPASAEKREAVRRVQGYYFQQPSRLNRSQLDNLRRINEGLVRHVTAQAPRLLRSTVKTQLVSMDHVKWEALRDELGEEVVTFVLELAPLGYRGVVTVDRPFAAACLDRMMGGQAAEGEVDANLTELDVRVFTSFIRAFLEPLPELWRNIGEFRVELGPGMQEAQGLDLFPPTEDLFQLCFLMQTSVGSGQVVLSVPFEAVRSLPPEAQNHEAPPAAGDGLSEALLRQSLKQVPVELTALLGIADIKVGKLLRARAGDVVVLNTRLTDAVVVKVNDKPKFRGYPGIREGKLAVKLIMEG